MMPAVSKAMERAERSRMAFDLQAIVIALEAYRQDHGDIPRTSPDGAEPQKFVGPPRVRISGAQILCQALIGPGEDTPAGEGDGAKGPGFRTRPPVGGAAQGKVFGPYLDVGKFNFGNPDGSDEDIRKDSPEGRDRRNRAVIIDRQNQPILYYPGLPRANINADNGYVSAMTFGGATPNRPMYNAGAGATNPGPGDTPIITKQNGLTEPIISQRALRLLLGDRNANGKIEPGEGETAAYTGPYLLMSAGPDEFFGPESDLRPISQGNRCDDVLNFDSPGNQ
jgi:hypothetical protein